MGKRVNTAVWIENEKRWRIRVQKDGVRKSFYSGVPGRTGQREANAKADAWLDEGVFPGAARVRHVVPRYLEYLKSHTSEGNYRPEESRFRIHILPVIGRVKIEDLSDELFQSVIDKASKADGTSLSKKSLFSLRASLFAFAKYCRRLKLTSFRPEFVKVPNSAPVGVRRILSPDDIVKIFLVDTYTYYRKKVPEPYINAFRFQILTGLRPGELIGLQWNDLRQNHLYISRSISDQGNLTSGKNDNAHREIYLFPSALRVWNDQHSLGKQSIYVFGITSQASYRRHWLRFCQDNGIPYITPYEIRHTFVSMIQGMPDGYIRKLVGHSKNMDTFGVYAHDTESASTAIISMLEETFSDILKSQSPG